MSYDFGKPEPAPSMLDPEPDDSFLQPLLFDIEEPWEKVWKGMPEFVQEDLSAWKSLTINFATPGDYAIFAKAIGQSLTPNTRSVWFPPAEIGRYANKRYSDKPGG